MLRYVQGVDVMANTTQTKESLAAKKATKKEKKLLKRKNQDKASAAAALDGATYGGEKSAHEAISAPTEGHPIKNGEVEGSESTGASSVPIDNSLRSRTARVEELEDDE
jgi:hypothetical protein